MNGTSTWLAQRVASLIPSALSNVTAAASSTVCASSLTYGPGPGCSCICPPSGCAGGCGPFRTRWICYVASSQWFCQRDGCC